MHALPVAVALAALFDGTLLAAGLFALVRGDRPEKLGALVNAVASIASSALRLTGLATWSAGGPTVAIDVAVAAAFYWLGCRTTRFWPVWSFGLSLAIVAVDVVKLALPHVSLTAFASGQIVYAYFALGSLVLGTARLGRPLADPHHGFRPPCPSNKQCPPPTTFGSS